MGVSFKSINYKIIILYMTCIESINLTGNTRIIINNKPKVVHTRIDNRLSLFVLTAIL